jgi:hypothetical protein
MAWTIGDFEGPLTAKAAVVLGLGEEFAAQVLDAAIEGTVVYVAVRSLTSHEVSALVLHTKQEKRQLSVKPVSEDQGPFEDRCPPRILDLLTAPKNDLAEEWRDRCRARLVSAADPALNKDRGRQRWGIDESQ